MPSSNGKTASYFDTLKERAKKSRVYRKFQLTGLLISRLLEDEKHKSLYIKLSKESDEERLLRLAKEVAERKQVKNKGAYFMTLFKKLRLKKLQKSKRLRKKIKPKRNFKIS